LGDIEKEKGEGRRSREKGKGKRVAKLGKKGGGERGGQSPNWTHPHTFGKVEGEGGKGVG
jgi:hypothetical protein